ncbi:MAG TPA: hypothetical protein VKB25_15490 [Conexibacter sp.]|nr:hypothetical protein [Conexibacter sp.]
MAEKRTLTSQYPTGTGELIAQGGALPAQRLLSDVLARIGPRHGPITDAGTRALQEQRGDVV